MAGRMTNVSGQEAIVITVRVERAEDIAQIREVNELAFEQALEADLVDRLRAGAAEPLSLVAVDGGTVLGHVLFSPVDVESNGRRVRGMGLAPMAVRPGRQREGIGTQLVTHGLNLLRESGCPFVVVVGHPGYYPRFGFVPAATHGLRSQWSEVPPEAFMVLVFDARAMRGIAGVARYQPAFEQV